MTQDEIIEMVKQTELKFLLNENWMMHDELEAFAKLVAQAEREACAKIVEDSPSYDWHKFACETAYAIRARGEQA